MRYPVQPCPSSNARKVEIPEHDKRRSETRGEGEDFRARHLACSEEKQQPQDAKDRR